MKRKCEQCQKEFEPVQPHFRLCPDCFSSSWHKKDTLSELLLKSYYDLKNNLVKEVFIGVPESLARVFARSRPSLKSTQLRDFYQKILKARNKALLKDINAARPILYECQRDAAYQVNRGVIPESFSQFLEHHIALAEKDEQSLEGFYQHVNSLVCYFPKEQKGG